MTVNAIAAAGLVTSAGGKRPSFPQAPIQSGPRKLMSPMGMAQPEEAAGQIAFIPSDEALYMTGSIVTMDGGVTV